MEPISELDIVRGDEEMELPPGFRFHPTDEELIIHYLSPKVLESNFSARAIGEVDLNKVEPWDLPWIAKMGEREWYFFCVRDRKYPTGLRTNRATEAGYWKATGKDKEIYRAKALVGMKKTLVFYKGRAPKGEKTNWVMHEYRLEGKSSLSNLPKTAKNEWVISRIFHKTLGGKKIHISGLMKISNHRDESQNMNLPPLLDCSAQDDPNKMQTSSSNETCFSDHSEDIKPDKNIFDSFNNCIPPSKPSDNSSVWDSLFYTQLIPNIENFQYPDMAQDQSILKIFLQSNNNFDMNTNFKTEFSPDTGMSTDISSVISNHEMGPITSAGPIDLDCLWNY